MALTLAGKTAIVTGAGSGINLAFASLLLSKNCNVIFADIALRPEAKKLVDEYSKQSRRGPRAIFQSTDVTRWDMLENMFKAAEEEFGGVDVVCPGAGVYEPEWSNFWYPPGGSSSSDNPHHSRYSMLDINLTHPIRTTQLAISHFLNPKSPRAPVSPQNPRSVIHISSIAGQTTPLVAPMYNASKHALSGFVRTLAPLDKGLGIRITAVAPGIIKTPLWTEHPEKSKMLSAEDEWVTPEFVAEKMVDMIEKDEIEDKTRNQTIKVEGGLILEVSKGRVRKVGQFNDSGPSGPGNTAAGVAKEEEEIIKRLKQEGWGV